MRASLLALAAARAANSLDLPEPTATFYFPLPLDQLADTFDTVDHFSFPRFPNPPVGQLTTVTFEIAIVIAVQGTVLYADHYEDGYDSYPNYHHEGTVDAFGEAGTTQIWGDGDPTNGIPPGYATDILVPGDVIELEATINVNNGQRTDGDPTLPWSGGDRIQSSHALAVTYYAFPIWTGAPKWFEQLMNIPGDRGTLLAGAVEVFANNFWDTNYVAPFGTGDGHDYEYCTFYVQAGDETTGFVIQNQGGGLLQDELILKQGETAVFNNVSRGDVVVADRPVQVHLITGDVASTWELRWYALAPYARWGDDYVAPVAVNLTSFWIYNDGPGDIEVSCDTSEGPCPGTFPVAAGKVRTFFMGVDIPLPAGGDDPGYTGVHFYSDSPFLVMMMMDNGNLEGGSPDEIWGATNNQRYDWGAPVVPTDQLSVLVVVPMGRGCRCEGCPEMKSSAASCHDPNQILREGVPFVYVFDDGTNFTSPSVSRSVIWISPVAPCTIRVEFVGKRSLEVPGTFGGRSVSAKGCASVTVGEKSTSNGMATYLECEVAAAYDSIRFSNDNYPFDISGAIIDAVAPDPVTTDLVPVKIAAMWGQDPHYSGTNDDQALDLGTFVTPITNPWASKAIVSVTHPDGTIDPNNTVTAIGDQIHYEIIITNVGVAPVTDLKVDDPLVPELQWDRTSLPPQVGYLRPNETWVYVGYYNVTAEDLVDGSCIRNDATAESNSGGGGNNLTSSTCARVVIADPTATPSSVPTPAPSSPPSFTPKPSGVPSMSPTVAPTIVPTMAASKSTTTAPITAAPTGCEPCAKDSECPTGQKCVSQRRRKLLFGYIASGCCRTV